MAQYQVSPELQSFLAGLGSRHTKSVAFRGFTTDVSTLPTSDDAVGRTLLYNRFTSSQYSAYISNLDGSSETEIVLER